jgi:hypothetical protein
MGIDTTPMYGYSSRCHTEARGKAPMFKVVNPGPRP